jgi:hypothetical protein
MHLLALMLLPLKLSQRLLRLLVLLQLGYRLLVSPKFSLLFVLLLQCMLLLVWDPHVLPLPLQQMKMPQQLLPQSMLQGLLVLFVLLLLGSLLLMLSQLLLLLLLLRPCLLLAQLL